VHVRLETLAISSALDGSEVGWRRWLGPIVIPNDTYNTDVVALTQFLRDTAQV
jgi:hypothetical protein